MSKNINEEDLKQNGLVDSITSFLNTRVVLSVLIALIIIISFSYPAVGGVSTISIVTDSSWKCLDAEVDGWTSAGFDDSWWDDTEELFYVEGFGNAKAIWYPGSPMPSTAYFRKTIDIDGGEVISGRINIAVYRYAIYGDEYVYIFVNANYVGRVSPGHYPYGEKEFDIAPYLKPGKNVIAVKADIGAYRDFFGEVRSWWALTSTIRYGTIPLTPTESIQTPTPIQTPAPVVSPIPSEYPSPTLKPGVPYVNLYGHKTDITVGETVILYLSVVNPITSPGTLKVQLTLQIPSGWSITSGEFSPPVGGFQTAVYEIEQGPGPKTIGIHMLANQPFDDVITGYTDYYFVKQPEPKYHKEVNEPVTAKEKKLLPSPTPRPAETPAPRPIIPGFEAILAIAGLLAVAYLLRWWK